LTKYQVKQFLAHMWRVNSIPIFTATLSPKSKDGGKDAPVLEEASLHEDVMREWRFSSTHL